MTRWKRRLSNIAASPFKRISWQINEAITTTKTNAMANNDNWLYENMPRLQYWGAVKRATGLKMLAGITYLNPAKTNKLGKTITFGSYFSAGCRPIIVTGTQGSNAMRAHCTFRGISNLNPDHLGFVVTLYASQAGQTFSSGVYVNCIAVGF